MRILRRFIVFSLFSQALFDKCFRSSHLSSCGLVEARMLQEDEDAYELRKQSGAEKGGTERRRLRSPRRIQQEQPTEKFSFGRGNGQGGAGAAAWQVQGKARPMRTPLTASPNSIPTSSTAEPTASPSLPPVRTVTCPIERVLPIPGGRTRLNKNFDADLCMIVVQQEDGEVQPVAISYRPGKDWEASAGHFADLEFACYPNACLVTLPPLPDSQFYQLVPMVASTPILSVEDEVARFLEQASFGASLTDIDNMIQQHGPSQTNSGDTQGDDSYTLEMFASWMQEQMDPSLTPPSLHRAFFRERLIARSEAPTQMSLVTHPCQKNTRYRLYAFSSKDWTKTVEIETRRAGNVDRRVIKIDGFNVAVATSITDDTPERNDFPDGSFEVCVPGIPFLDQSPQRPRNSKVALNIPGLGCRSLRVDGVYGNVPISFDDEIGAVPNKLINLEGSIGALVPENEQYYADLTPNVQELLLTRDLFDEFPEECGQIGTTGNPQDPVFVLWNGKHWIHDPRFVLEQNTVESPLLNGGGNLIAASLTRDGNVRRFNTVSCSTAPRSFVNEEGCRISTEDDVCGLTEVRSTQIRLTPSNIRRIYDITSGQSDAPETRYVYAIDNLEINTQNPSPCEPLSTSRWIQGRCNRPSPSMTDQTQEALAFYLSASEDRNRYVRDIFMPEEGGSNLVCDPLDHDKHGFEIEAGDGTFWCNVHPQHLQVFDMTYWTRNDTHPGNSVLDENPIKRPARDGSHILEYPLFSHPMVRWEEHQRHFDSLGRLDDWVDVVSFPENLLTEEIAVAFGALDAVREQSAVICGSPGEVGNDLGLGGDFRRGAFDAFTRVNRTSFIDDLAHQRKQVWTSTVLASNDQLRQRMAWALSQILVVSAELFDQHTEANVAYYDIFVRHAFGNYKDILMEVAYSPLMAEMLTYVDSKSTGYVWETSGATQLEYPDENMAREVMQLFSTGIHELQLNGNPVVKDGNFVRVYLNDDIEEYARMWTGFRRHGNRGNVERFSNYVDPMLIEPAWRDAFPKLGLRGEYIGDRYPLCSDLPRHDFLMRGARYRRIDSSGRPELQTEPSSWGRNVNPIRFMVTKDSGLYQQLCAAPPNDDCRYPMSIVLDTDLTCVGDECTVDTVRTVEVDIGIFYEYIRPPCVQKAFFSDARKIVGTTHDSQVLCGDPTTAAAGAACCSNVPCCGSGIFNIVALEASSPELYWGERVAFNTAADRCQVLCPIPDMSSFCGRWRCSSHFWTTSPCQIIAKIDPSDGTVAIVHHVEDVTVNKIANQLQEDTKTFFRVHWRKGNSELISIAEVLDSVSASDECWYASDGAHLCPVSVETRQAFSTRPTHDEVLTNLWTGAFPPDPSFDQVTQHSRGGVVIHNFEGKTREDVFGDSIFEVTDEVGRTFFLKNEVSVVRVADTDLYFRNPPHFVDLANREVRDMHYETAAGIEQYLFHPSTAPFLSIRLAQRFGNSNPSPRYIAVIAEAFRQGTYSSGGRTFGSGVYGDLEATVAAVLLDIEARDIKLDSVYGHGSLKEPLLKLISTMRALEFSPKDSQPLTSFQPTLREAIGQDAHELPSVFSFFLPEFKLGGSRAENAGLVTPEAMALTGPKVISTMNGLFSLVRFGLDDCFGGLGLPSPRPCNELSDYGVLRYSPTQSDSQGVVNELATLLTAGRLSSFNRQVAQEMYDQIPDKEIALVLVQQLILSSAEFHSTGRTQETGIRRPSSPEPTPSSIGYKAVVVIILTGGVDSWNMLVPHQCNGVNQMGKTVREQYNDERGALSFIESERTRTVSVDDERQKLSQPCSQFAVHDELAIVQELYDNGDLAFLANMGVLNRPVNKSNYNENTVTSLFAHNSMQLESERIDPYNESPNTGILGRALDVLEREGFRANSLSIDKLSLVGRGGPGQPGPDSFVVNRKGPDDFNPGAAEGSEWDISNAIADVTTTSVKTSNVYGEIWNDRLSKSLDESKLLLESLDRAPLQGVSLDGSPHKWEEMTAMVSRLIQSHGSRGVDRDVIQASFDGWDHHRNMKEQLRTTFKQLNSALTLFTTEMKALGLWDQTTLVLTSDFGRTLTQNTGGGSDHAWGGHYFIMGGQVAGSQIHGQYPSDITSSGPLNIGRGRGRIIPELSWESMYNSVVQWLGVTNEEDLDYVMPNRHGTGAVLFNEDDLFVSENVDGGNVAAEDTNPTPEDEYATRTAGTHREEHSNQSSRNNIFSW